MEREPIRYVNHDDIVLQDKSSPTLIKIPALKLPLSHTNTNSSTLSQTMLVTTANTPWTTGPPRSSSATSPPINRKNLRSISADSAYVPSSVINSSNSSSQGILGCNYLSID
jgi:hypothetical protein